MDKYIVFDIETTGLRPTEGHPITCICSRDNEDNWFYEASRNEREIITKFLNYIRAKQDYKLISANGKDFDIPYILLRAYLNGVSFDLSFELIKREHFDIINDITSKKVSLNDLAKLYNFELKSGDGLRAIKLFEEGDFNKLIEYCSDDVRLTEKVYLKYKQEKQK